MVGQAQDSTLFGRDDECRVIDGLLAQAEAGASGVLAIRGEAGIGKSALLAYARDRADGMTVLTARGVEAESELAFATLHELLRPILDRMSALPPPQQTPLASAFALGPRAPLDAFAVGVATLGLLAAAAEERPVLALVDDAHWADSSSLDAILFAARRLGAEAVVLLLTMREGEDSCVQTRGLEHVALSPLPREACAELLAAASGAAVAWPVAYALATATAGNPLALTELAPLLTAAELAGREPLPEPLPAVDVESAFLASVAELPERSQRALLLAAASDTGAVDEIDAAARQLGLTWTDFTPTEDLALVRVEDGQVRFRHPLLRAAVYHTASVEERRAAHLALADALAHANRLERRAWHLATAAATPDEAVATALTEAAASATARSDHMAAAAALERAARLTPAHRERVNRLLAAAEAAQAAGRFDHAAGLLDEALPDVPPERRVDAVRLRAAVDLWRGRARDARQLLVGEADRIEEHDPSRAAAMLVEAAIPAVMALDIEAAAELALRARAIAEHAPREVQMLAAGVAGACLAGRGDARRARPLLEYARPLIEQSLPTGPIPPMVRHFVWHLYIVLEWYVAAERLYDTAIHEARAASVPSLLPFPLAFRAELRFRTGDWHSAFVDASESALLAEQTGQWTQLPHSLAVLARIEAGRGDGDACRTHCERARELATEHGSDAIKAYTALALGLLELGLGRSDEAAAKLEPAAELIDSRHVSPAAVPLHADLIEAYIRQGRVDAAERALAPLERWAADNEHSWTRAACARCRGLLALDDELDGCLGRALELHQRTTTAFERARTQLAYGERLRRARRLIEAREPLHVALSTFEELGARPWVQRTRTELRAARDAPREHDQTALEELTAQELQVARLVADGVTNREAGAALFLSPKTIDFHLRNVYRKLGVRSRTQLSRVMTA